MEKSFKKWCRAEKLGIPEGLMLLDGYIEYAVSKLLSTGRKDGQLLRMIEGRRRYREAIDEGDFDDDFDGDYDAGPPNKKDKKKKLDLWYIR